MTQRNQLSKRLEKFLIEHKAKYKVLQHRTVFTAFDTAQTLKVDLGSVAKTLIVQMDRGLALVVIPADRNLDFAKLKKLVNLQRKAQGLATLKKVALTTERSIASKVAKKPGAIVPFGALYKLGTYVDKSLLQEPHIILNAGSFEVSFSMRGSTYGKLADAVVGQFSKKRN
ncbi:MAG: YbaK/EbsC family protein [Parcubacteria group bacterium]